MSGTDGPATKKRKHPADSPVVGSDGDGKVKAGTVTELGNYLMTQTDFVAIQSNGEKCTTVGARVIEALADIHEAAGALVKGTDSKNAIVVVIEKLNALKSTINGLEAKVHSAVNVLLPNNAVPNITAAVDPDALTQRLSSNEL